MSDTKAGSSTMGAAPPPDTAQTNTAPPPTKSGFLNRALSKDNRQTAKRFFSAYAQTWVGLSPIWLMGEAITGKKVGTQFNKGKGKLFEAADEVRKAVATSSKDVVVIVDEKLRSAKGDTGRTAEVIKAAGENAILVVTTSLEKIQGELKKQDFGPELKNVMAKNGRDVIVILDKALKHPVVVTGVTQFAKSKGIPHADALLRLGSLALARVLRAMPEEVQQSEAGQELGAKIEEIDAVELERTSSVEEKNEAQTVGEQAGANANPQVQGTDPYSDLKKRNDCIVM